MTEKIEIKLEYTGGYGEYGCMVCGGRTSAAVICEGHDESGELIRVRETCLEAGDLDSRLQQRAADLDEFAEWKAAVAELRAEQERADAELELAEGSEGA
jgi:hypothetical protein